MTAFDKWTAECNRLSEELSQRVWPEGKTEITWDDVLG